MKSLWILLMALAGPVAAHGQESPLALQEAFMNAMRANDVEGMAECYSDDAVLYTMGSPSGLGPESVREDWNKFFSRYRVVDASLFGTGMEIRDDLAVAWGQFHIMAEPASGGEVVRISGRFTDVAQRIDRRWRYIVDHVSPDPLGGQSAGMQK